MFPFKTSFTINRKANQAIYLQLANQFIELIKDRKLPPETKLPGSRTLANLLQVHRKTIVACYDELLLQGWIESIHNKAGENVVICLVGNKEDLKNTPGV